MLLACPLKAHDKALLRNRNMHIVTVLFLPLIFSVSSVFADDKIERKVYNPWEEEIGYSQVVRAGNTIYVSGIASDKPTLEEQVQEIYQLIQNTLIDNGLDMSSIVKQVVYTTDIEAYKKLGEIRKSHFNENEYPSSTLVQVERLYSPNHMVEIEVIAYIEE